MVNFRTIALGFVILLAAMGAGIVVGMQLGGGDAPQASDAGEGGDSDGGSGGATATATATPTNGTGNATATPTATVTATPTATPTGTPAPSTDKQEPYVPPSYYDEAEIEQQIADLINERRQEASLDPMSTTGTTADQLRAMARDHSVAMGQDGKVRHEVSATDTTDRYENNDLYDTCRFQPQGKAYTKSPDDSFEAIGRTVAGRLYEEDGTEQFNIGTIDIAEAIVEDWFSSSVYRDRLTYANTGRMGVGVNVTSSGEVYATVNVCG